MDKQEITVSRGPIKRKVLSYWKKPSTHNGSLFSHLLLCLCSALADAINRFVIWWWIRPLLKLLCCQKWVCPSSSPVVTVNEERPRSWAWMRRKVYFLLLGSAVLQLACVRADTKICWLSSHVCQGFSSRLRATDGIPRNYRIIVKMKGGKKFQRNCVPFWRMLSPNIVEQHEVLRKLSAY